MIKGVIFDMDGLMFDTETLALNIWQDLLRENNLYINNDFIYSIRGRNSNDAKELFKIYYPNCNIDYDILRNEKNERLTSYLLNSPIPHMKGLINILNYLKDNNIKMAVASSTRYEYIIKYLEKEQILSYFDFIVGGDKVCHSKPSPEIFNIAFSGLNIEDKSNVVVLEDSKAGIYAAVNGGFRPIWIPNDLYYHELEEKCIFKAKDLDEVIAFIDNENHLDVLIKSFEAKIILANDFIKNAYFIIIRNIERYNLTKKELFSTLNYYDKNKKIISMKMTKDRLYVYLDLEYEEDNQYIFNQDEYKKYNSTSTLVKVYDEESLKICLNLLIKLFNKLNLLPGFDLYQESLMIHRYLNRPLEILEKQGLVYYDRQVRSKYNNGLVNDLVNVTFCVTLHNDLDVDKLYLVGNLDILGNWDIAKGVEFRKITKGYFELNMRLPKVVLEFKVCNQLDYIGVEKGFYKEEIKNHSYVLKQDIIIKDEIYNFRNIGDNYE